MDKLQTARLMINDIDKEMAELFCKRMEASRLVAEYKQEHGLPIYDATREDAVITRNSALVEKDDIRAYYVNFLKNTMKLSRQYQHLLMNGMKVAYSGVEGAFAHIASGRIFPDANLISYSSFEDAYRAVTNGECDCAVLPIENSYAGEVGQVMDLVFNGSLYVNGIYDLEISQNLLGISDAKLSDIRTVISHPQALDQCRTYIQEHNFEEIQAVNTARAAQAVANGGDKTIAAIASKETAEIYNLKVLDHDINESNFNTTRFAVLSRAENTNTSPDDNSFLLLFTVSHQAGALAKAINVIGEYGYNMRLLRSRPVKNEVWQYYFYLEAEGNVNSPEGREMLMKLKEYCQQLKVAGNFNGGKI